MKRNIHKKRKKLYKPKYKDELKSFINHGDLTDDSVVSDLYIQRKLHKKPVKTPKIKVKTFHLSKEEMEEYIENT